MSLFVIGDTHLSFGSPKPMDVFEGWAGFEEKLQSNWRARVGPEDTVVIAGDFSWAMSLEEAAARLADELETGYAMGYHHGGIGEGTEFRTWSGLQTGYEGTLIGNFTPMYALAVERGWINPPEPEWWG